MKTIKHEKVKARKVHYCDWCGLDIKIGEHYHSSFNEYCGDVYMWKNHQSCQDIAEKLRMVDDAYEGVTQDHFLEAIDQEHCDIMSKEHNELYESDNYSYPEFVERLRLVLDYHKVPHTF